MKSTSFSRHIEECLAKHLQIESVAIKRAVPAHGGSINECFMIETNEGKFFMKRNDAEKFPGMFQAEAEGLLQLFVSPLLKIPTPLFHGVHKGIAYLVMDYIESGIQDDIFWEKFGHGMAELHKQTSEDYGATSNNYIGSLPQYNTKHRHWYEFFIEQRLKPQINLALDKQLLNRKDLDTFELLYKKLDSFFPVELPSLVHGDMWSGNFLCGINSQPVIFDPACYYGHREMDIAMSKLFGGFNQKFYKAYQEIRPLEKGWEERTDICNLYPLLVHLNLFGGGYYKQIEMTLRKFTA